MKIKLDTLENASDLVNLCKSFDEDVNIEHGRYIVDGKSLLGVISFMGNLVEVNIVTDNESIKNRFMISMEELRG